MLNTPPSTPLLAGAPNFRDLGGYTTEDGRRVRNGLIYRSESLSELSEYDLSVARNLGIRLICDLRSHDERQHFPSRWPAHPLTDIMHLDISADVRAGYAAMTKALLDNPSEQGATQAMLLSYRQFPTAFAPQLAMLFEKLLSGNSLPLVFNCAAGKDRTGFLAAILLSVLGVPWEQVLEDYLMTAKLWHGPRTEAVLEQTLHTLLGQPPSREVLQPLIAVNEQYLASAFEAIINQYTSVEAYLELTAGLNTQRRTALQTALLQ